MSNLLVRDSSGAVQELKATGTGTTIDPIVPEQKICDTGPVKQAFFQRIDMIGDGTGTTNQAVNGSVTPVTFKFAPAADKIARVTRVIFSVIDTGSIDPTAWGNAVTMTNGIDINVKLSSTIVPVLNFPIKTTGDLVGVSGSVNHLNFGNGDEIIVMRADFTNSGQYMRLDGSAGDEFQIVINDDLTGINEQHMLIEGYYE